MIQRPTTQPNKNKNTNKKFYPKKKNGKKTFWKDYKNSSTNKNETQNSPHTFTTKGKWYDNNKKHQQRSKNYNSNKEFHPINKQNNKKNWNNNSNKKYNNRNNSKINSVSFKLKNFPDSERTVYNFKRKKNFKRRFFYDPLFLQQYAKNIKTGACLYVKPPTKHNILYPFLLNFNLINEHIKKR